MSPRNENKNDSNSPKLSSPTNSLSAGSKNEMKVSNQLSPKTSPSASKSEDKRNGENASNEPLLSLNTNTAESSIILANREVNVVKKMVENFSQEDMIEEQLATSSPPTKIPFNLVRATTRQLIDLVKEDLMEENAEQEAQRTFQKFNPSLECQQIEKKGEETEGMSIEEKNLVESPANPNTKIGESKSHNDKSIEATENKKSNVGGNIFNLLAEAPMFPSSIENQLCEKRDKVGYEGGKLKRQEVRLYARADEACFYCLVKLKKQEKEFCASCQSYFERNAVNVEECLMIDPHSRKFKKYQLFSAEEIRLSVSCFGGIIFWDKRKRSFEIFENFAESMKSEFNVWIEEWAQNILRFKGKPWNSSCRLSALLSFDFCVSILSQYLFIDSGLIHEYILLMKHKKQVVFFGQPGTGFSLRLSIFYFSFSPKK